MQDNPTRETVEDGVSVDWFDSWRAAPTEQPTATIQLRVMTLNKAAVQGLGWPEAVELGYDPDKRIIAIRAAEPSSPRAVGLRRQRGSSTHELSCKRFLKFYGIEHERSRRYPARMSASGEVLLVDLAGGGTDVSAKKRQSREDG